MTTSELPEVVIDLREGLSEKQLLLWLGYAFRGSDAFRRMQAFYMVELAERGVFRIWGYSSAVHFAVTRFGIRDRTARELLAVGRQLLVLPLIDQAFLEGKTNWSQTRLLTRICTEETQEVWLERAAQVSIRQLEREVAGSEKGREPRTDRRGLPEITLRVTANVDVITHELWVAARQKFQDECFEMPDERDFVRMLCEMYLSTRADGTVPGRKAVDDSLYNLVFDVDPRQGTTLLRTEDGPVAMDGVTSECLACDAGVEASDDGAQDPRAKTTEQMRRKILKREGYRCWHCGSRFGLMAHYIVPRSLSGPTVPSNLVSICAACHALVHAGLLQMKGTMPGALVILDRRGRDPNRAGLADVKRIRIDRTSTNGAHAPRDEEERLAKILRARPLP